MLDFTALSVQKSSLRHNDRVFCVNIDEYSENDQMVSPFIATVKIDDDDKLYFDCDDDTERMYSDHEAYIVIKKL